MKLLKGKLYIQKKNFPEWLIFFVLFLPFIIPTLHQLLSFPQFIYYIIDILLIVCLGLVIMQRQVKANRTLFVFFVYIILFLIYTIITYIFNYQSLFYYLWGVRNNFRFFVAFMAFGLYLKEQDAKNYLQILDVLFWVNAIVSVIQFFLLNFQQDYLGGIFGIEKGGNGYQFLFLSIIVVRSLIRCFNHEESILLCGSKCLVSLLIASIAELKFFFIDFAIIVALTMLVTSFSWRKLVVVLISFIGIIFAISVLAVVFPSTVGFFTLDILLESATSTDGYTASGDLNRFSAIPIIANQWFSNNFQRLFGLGLGNCDTSRFAFLNSEFYVRYSHMHYQWFHTAFLFLEGGYIGLILFFVFFILVFIKARKLKNQKATNCEFAQLAMVISLNCLLIMFYNSSLRTEAGYMAYFVLALPFINYKQLESKNE